jgi:alpha-L-rhamnosidase
MQMRDSSREKVLGLVEFFKKYENEYGLLENLESWVFIEWSKCNDPEYISGINYPSNMLWAAALDAAAELYNLPELSEKASVMRETIRKLSWNGEFFEENSLRDEAGGLVRTGHTTETGQYYAFYFDVASPGKDREHFEKMRTVFGPRRDAQTVYPDVFPSNAIVGNYLRLEILLRYGYTDQVLQECRDFFLKMAELTGTLWEHSKLSASLNHGFASMAAVYIDECMKQRQNS